MLPTKMKIMQSPTTLVLHLDPQHFSPGLDNNMLAAQQFTSVIPASVFKRLFSMDGMISNILNLHHSLLEYYSFKLNFSFDIV